MKIYPIGTTGKAARDLKCMFWTIKKGSAVTITGIDTVQPCRGYELTDQLGFCITGTGYDSIIPDNPDIFDDDV